MVIQHNLPAMNSRRALKKNRSSLSKSLEKLSSGYKINHAGDDAAGLAVSEKMRSQIAGMKQAIVNCQDGVSLVQTFEGALGETVAIIRRLKTLADQSANGTYDDNVDRNAVQVEFLSLCEEVDQIADTDFNGLCMLNGGEMADGFTFLTPDGTKWKTPSSLDFDDDTYVSTFKSVEGFPEIKMSARISDNIKGFTYDKEFMEGMAALGKARVRGRFVNGTPTYSLTGLSDEWAGKFTVTNDGYNGTISLTTEKSGTVVVGYIESTEFPHYASTAGYGAWSSRSVASASWVSLAKSNPSWTENQLEKFTERYVDSSSATPAERQNYVRWMRATKGTGTLVDDEIYDQDGETVKFIWSVNNTEYESDSNANHEVPVYTQEEMTTNGWPQLYLEKTYFYQDDENMKPGAKFYVSSSSYSSAYGGTWNGKSYIGATGNFQSGKWKDIWETSVRTTFTLTYNSYTNKWHDNYYNKDWDGSDWGITNRYYNYSEQTLQTDAYARQQDAKNLYHILDENGKLPDGFTMSYTVESTISRYKSSSGTVWNEKTQHLNGNTENPYDLKMGELDPAHPEYGGLDWEVAKNGAVYTWAYDDDGINGKWYDSDGNAVDLEAEGVYLPEKLTSVYRGYTTYYYNPLHDGMKIVVNNPTMAGEDWIEAELDTGIDGTNVNIYRGIYDNLTYADNLILQTNARSKDAVNFTMKYNSDYIGGLEANLNCTAKGLGLDKLSLATQEEANYAIDQLDFAANKISLIRGNFGAIQNRLEHKIDNLNNSVENLTSAESTIRDTDMAAEMMKFTKEQILSQASQAMLAQASTLPQGVMSLISV